MEIDILAFGAHPDDVECAAAGLVLSVTANGGKVVIADLTKGEMGTFGDEFSRQRESAEAARLLGLHNRIQLDMGDGNIENNLENRLEIIKLIRFFRPKIVLANALHDRHPDHKKAAELVSEAAFLSGLKKIETTYEGATQSAYRPQSVYFYVQDYFIEPNFVVDISPYFQQKINIIKAYETQFVSAKDDSLNGNITLLKQIESTNHIFGRAINVAFAEGFTSKRYIGVKNILNLL